MRQFSFVHLGVAAALAAATVSALGLIQAVGAAGSGASSVFVPIVPCRLADTRPGSEHVGTHPTKLGPTESVTFAVWGTNGNCTIPTTATGIATNVTAVNPTADSYVTIYPADANPRPTASNLNVTSTSPPTPNQVTVGLSTTGAIAAYNNGGTLDLVIDIVGYYEPAGAGATGPQGPIGPQGPQGPPGEPAGATIVLSGLDGIYGSGVDFVPIINACIRMRQDDEVLLPIALPVGALITDIDVHYDDMSTAELDMQLYVTDRDDEFGGVSNQLGSVNGQTVGSLTLDELLPASSPDDVFYLRAFATDASAAQPVSFCGADVTYTMP